MAATEHKQDIVILGSPYPADIAARLNNAAADLGYKSINASIDGFKSTERFCELFAQNAAEISGANAHVIMNMSDDMNENFVDTLNTIETLKEYGAQSVHVIMGFAPYARQDRHFDNRMVSVMGKTVPKHLKSAGADTITTFDMHSKNAEAFYTDFFGVNHVHFISAVDLIQNAVQNITMPGDCIKYGAPDGADKPDDVAQCKARQITKLAHGADAVLNDHMFGITKTHTGVNNTKITGFTGNVAQCVAVEIDDMTDTGGTLVNGARVLKEHGAKRVIAAVTHGIFSGNSLSDLTADTQDNPIDTLITTDSVLGIYKKAASLSAAQQKRLVILPIEPLLKRALALKFN